MPAGWFRSGRSTAQNPAHGAPVAARRARVWKTRRMWAPWAGSALRLSTHTGLFTCHPGLGGAADGQGQDPGQPSPWEPLRGGGQFTVRGTPVALCVHKEIPLSGNSPGASTQQVRPPVCGPTPSFSDWPRCDRVTMGPGGPALLGTQPCTSSQGSCLTFALRATGRDRFPGFSRQRLYKQPKPTAAGPSRGRGLMSGARDPSLLRLLQKAAGGRLSKHLLLRVLRSGPGTSAQTRRRQRRSWLADGSLLLPPRPSVPVGPRPQRPQPLTPSRWGSGLPHGNTGRDTDVLSETGSTGHRGSSHWVTWGFHCAEPSWDVHGGGAWPARLLAVWLQGGTVTSLDPDGRAGVGTSVSSAVRMSEL